MSRVHLLGIGALDRIVHSNLEFYTMTGVVSAGLLHGEPYRLLGLRDFGLDGSIAADLGFPYDGKTPLPTPLKKSWLVKRALDRLPPNDFVLYLDATDALMQRPTSELVYRYFQILARLYGEIPEGSEPVLFNGIAHCFPFQEWSQVPHRYGLGRYRENHSYRVSASGERLRSRDLCSNYLATFRGSDGTRAFPEPGLWFGRIRGARRMMQRLLRLMVEEEEGLDQAALIPARLQEPDLFVVDGARELLAAYEVEVHWRTAFHDMRGPGGVHLKGVLGGPRARALSERAWKVFNRTAACSLGRFLAGTVASSQEVPPGPAALHFPGPAKFAMHTCFFNLLEAHLPAGGSIPVLAIDDDRGEGVKIATIRVHQQPDGEFSISTLLDPPEEWTKRYRTFVN